VWAVSGPCEVADVDAACVTSPGYPGNYGINESCTLSLSGNTSKYLHVRGFDTEFQFDKLIFSNGAYEISGDFADAFSMEGWHIVGSITWSSDGSINGQGWKICAQEAGVQASGSCEVDPVDDACVMSRNYPYGFINDQSCLVSNYGSPPFGWEMESTHVGGTHVVFRTPLSSERFFEIGADDIHYSSGWKACARSQNLDASSVSSLWNISGPCQVSADDEACVTSPGYPGDYGVNEYCSMSLTSNISKYLDVEDFETESGADTLVCTEENYEASGDFEAAKEKLQGLRIVGAITWSSDHSVSKQGWKICARDEVRGSFWSAFMRRLVVNLIFTFVAAVSLFIFAALYQTDVVEKLPLLPEMRQQQGGKRELGIFSCFRRPSTCMYTAFCMPLVAGKNYKATQVTGYWRGCMGVGIPGLLCLSQLCCMGWPLLVCIRTKLSQRVQQRLGHKTSCLKQFWLSACCMPCDVARESLEVDAEIGAEITCCFKVAMNADVESTSSSSSSCSSSSQLGSEGGSSNPSVQRPHASRPDDTWFRVQDLDTGLFDVKVPAGIMAGSSFESRSPFGNVLTITVPPGAGPGKVVQAYDPAQREAGRLQKIARQGVVRAAKAIQLEDGGFAGADYLHKNIGAEYWGITMPTFLEFVASVRAKFAAGEVTNSGSVAYADDLFQSPRVGPSMYQINEQVIKPMTADPSLELPGASWALMSKDIGTHVTLFVTHAWAEGVFEFASKLQQAWPKDENGTCQQAAAYICFLSNPQNLDISELLTEIETSPFNVALQKMPKPGRMIMIPTENVPIHERLWCVFEAHTAMQLDIPISVGGPSTDLARSRTTAVAFAGMAAAGPELIEKYEDELEKNQCSLIVQAVFVFVFLAATWGSFHWWLKVLQVGISAGLLYGTVSKRRKLVMLMEALREKCQDGSLMDVSKAKCTSDSDAEKIRAAISGKEDSINAMLGKLIVYGRGA